MSNVTIYYNAAPKVTLNEIPIGTFFTGRIGPYEEKLFLRAYDFVVAVDDPNKTWSRLKMTSVRGYAPVNVEITVTR